MTKTILILIFFSIALNSYSQKGKDLERRYYYNFQQKRLYTDITLTNFATAPIKYRAGRDINIDIKNYNPLKYEISINETSSEYFLKDTAKLSSYIILPSIPSAANAIPLDSSKPNTAPVLEAFNQTISNSNAVGVTKVQLDKAKLNACNVIKNGLKKLNDSKESFEKSISIYKNLITTIEGINNTYDNLKSLDVLTTTLVKAELVNSFINPLNSFLNSNSSMLISTDPTLVSSGNLDDKELDFYNRILKTFKDIEDIKNATAKIQNTPVCSDFSALYKEFLDNYELISKAENEFITSRTGHLTQFKTTTSLYNKIKHYAITEPEIVSSAITIQKDMHTITINTKTGTDAIVAYDNIHVQPSRGVKVDVATGFFFSNLSDNSFFKHSKDSIHHKDYVVDGTVRDTIVQESFTSIYRKKNVNLSFGGMVYIQAHSQNPGNWNYGGYLGFGALFNDQARWSGSAGGSLLIGQIQRFTINVGLIISQVDRLSPPYQTDTWYQETIDNIPTYRAWKAGVMVGFSWNL